MYYAWDVDRLAGSCGDTWFINQQGVWRAGPGQPEPLRYLPPEPRDGLAWRQGDVYFLLHFMRDEWWLTVLEAGWRTIMRIEPGKGVVWMLTEEPSGIAVGQLVGADEHFLLPDRSEMLAHAAPAPTVFPSVHEVLPEEFHAQIRAYLQRVGRPFLEIDLTGDGRPERIEGAVGSWAEGPLLFFDADGRYQPNFGQTEPMPYRLDLANLPVRRRPALLYQRGGPGTWHQVVLSWWSPEPGGGLFWTIASIVGWGSGAAVRPDGRIEIDADPDDMAGYSWTRLYRIESDTDNGSFRAVLDEETLLPGPYPTTPEALLTAAWVALWYRRPADMERYIPDAAVRNQFLATRVGRPPMYAGVVQTGRLGPDATEFPHWPTLEQAPADQNGEADFLVRVDWREGWMFHVGRVAFGTAPDGRLIIRTLDLKETVSRYAM